MNYKNARILSLGLSGLGILLMIYLIFFLEFSVLYFSLFAAAIALHICGTIIAKKFCVCPHCHMAFPVTFKEAKQCPSCGKGL